MKRKTSHHSKKSDTSYKIVDIYKDLFTFREKPVSEEFVERVMHDAMEQAVRQGKMFKVTSYFRKLGIPWQTVKRWRDKWPWFEEVYQELVGAVGDNRELGALEKKLDSSIVMFTQPLYDPDWKQETERRAKLKEPQDAATNPITVVIENVKESE